MIKKIIVYSLIFLLALLVFLAANMPAKFIWKEGVEPNINLRQVGLDVQAVEGTVWQGEALVKYKNLSSILSWDIDLMGLFTLSLPVSLEVDSQAGKLSADLSAGLSAHEIYISKADIDLSQLNGFLRRQRVTLAGELFIKDLLVKADGTQVSYGEGIASWSGGEIAYPAQRSVHEREMPPFQIKLETKPDGEIYAGVRDSGGTMDVIEASLTPEGQAMVVVKRRLLDLADEHWPANSKETDSVFKVKKMIY